MLKYFFSRRVVLLGTLVHTTVILWPHLSWVLLFQPKEKTYSIRILSYDPLIVYVVEFLSWVERAYLRRLGKPLFERSTVYNNGAQKIHMDRTSSTAYLPEEDRIVQRIIRRASEIQGYTNESLHESLQRTRYGPGQLFRSHVDPLEDSANETSTHRLTTIFAIVEATCDRCGTQFPNILLDWTLEDPSWCKFVEFGDVVAVSVKAVPGNALF
ncbi:prolyl 4-hydroxylase 10-like protein 1 [Colletotrichum limetticola]|uniref:Prolyl 4-hydroxylase 10-like protein 1 n=1 Tax=Colletotrichum limetticola TaxID=1209924 RepID=A0ABQ9PBS2_9PEZI|nr:prolyl 4-hydroxylase 10-like protein 1 [Colletotrichum limetticola]